MTIDIDATRARVLAVPGCSVVDIACVLLDEIERLRAEIARTEQIVADNAHWFRAQERERIVAWLRERQPGWPAGSGGHADAIERGEHNREEKQEEEEEHDPSDDWRFCEGCGCRKQTARARSWSDHSWCDDCTSRE